MARFSALMSCSLHAPSSRPSERHAACHGIAEQLWALSRLQATEQGSAMDVNA